MALLVVQASLVYIPFFESLLYMYNVGVATTGSIKSIKILDVSEVGGVQILLSVRSHS